MNRRQSLLLLSVVLGLAGVLAWRVMHHSSADRALDEGRSALRSGDPVAARGWFDLRLKARPEDPEAHFLAAIAARRAGDRASAASHLEHAGRRGWDAVDLRAEGALQAVAAGAPFVESEAALRAILDRPSENTSDALEHLSRGSLAQFRVSEAERLTARWVELAPENPRAWEVRADVLERLERRGAAREALARWVELDPANLKARLGLVRLLLDDRRPSDEITPHLEILTTRAPDNVEVMRFHAAALQAEGRTEDARAVLDRAVAVSAPGCLVLAQRAKLDLDRGRAGEALPFARRAVAADPSDVEARFTLLRCVQQVGTPAEAAAAEASWKQVRDDLARVRATPADWRTSNYAGSLGPQCADGGCGSNPNQTYCNSLTGIPGSPDHGNSFSSIDIRGMYNRLGAKINMAAATDGLSNTILLGEVIPMWHDHYFDGSWVHFNGGASHVSTIVPINYRTDDRNRCGSNPLKSYGNWNVSWGFKSLHTGGANFVFGDGSVRFLTESISHTTYQYLGARADGKPVAIP